MAPLVGSTYSTVSLIPCHHGNMEGDMRERAVEGRKALHRIFRAHDERKKSKVGGAKIYSVMKNCSNNNLCKRLECGMKGTGQRF